MEENRFQGRPGSSSQQKKYRYTFWGIWGPVIINWLIGGAVGFVAIAALTVIYVSGHQDLILQMFEDEALKTQITELLLKQYLDYSTIVQGAASVVAIPIMWSFFKKDRLKLKGYEPEYRPVSVICYLSIAVLSITAGFVMNSFLIIGNFSSYSDQYEMTMESFYSAPISIQILCLGILVPIAEELVFRGLVFKRFRAYEGFWKSANASSFIFALVHGNLVQAIYALFLGMLLAYMYEKTGSLKAPILAHACMNILSVIATEAALFDKLSADFTIIAIVTVLCSALGASMFVYLRETEYMIKEEVEEAATEN